MMPLHEHESLAETKRQAIALALEGRFIAGYTCLLDGLELAVARAAESVSFGDELVEQWQKACDDYVADFGLKLNRAPSRSSIS
jgi:hypothetical protein